VFLLYNDFDLILYELWLWQSRHRQAHPPSSAADERGTGSSAPLSQRLGAYVTREKQKKKKKKHVNMDPFWLFLTPKPSLKKN
jgi:hypothetical protein